MHEVIIDVQALVEMLLYPKAFLNHQECVAL